MVIVAPLEGSQPGSQASVPATRSSRSTARRRPASRWLGFVYVAGKGAGAGCDAHDPPRRRGDDITVSPCGHRPPGGPAPSCSTTASASCALTTFAARATDIVREAISAARAGVRALRPRPAPATRRLHQGRIGSPVHPDQRAALHGRVRRGRQEWRRSTASFQSPDRPGRPPHRRRVGLCLGDRCGRDPGARPRDSRRRGDLRQDTVQIWNELPNGGGLRRRQTDGSRPARLRRA